MYLVDAGIWRQSRADDAVRPEIPLVASLVSTPDLVAKTTSRFGSPSCSVTVERGDAHLIDQIAPAWRALCDEGPCADPFFRPEWIGAYLRHLEPDARVVLITAWRNGSLRAVLPLIEERTRFFGVPLRRW
ncbi:MAG: hypothetical protein C4346_11365, partial [Chloroflexota bacterium]